MKSLPPILFEDEAVLAFDKPTGLLTAPDRWDPKAANLMEMIHRQLGGHIFNVHRLDRDTSGILLCAKTKAALDSMTGQFQARTVLKRYLAITLGSPLDEKTTVSLPISEDSQRPGRMRINRHSDKSCKTRFRMLIRWRGYSLIEAFPLTGRTHQIRVHLRHLGCPVLADPLYGSGAVLMLSAIKSNYKHKEDEPEKPLMGRLALHAESVTLNHPVTGQPLTIQSPLPKEFEVSIKYLKRFAGL